VARGIVARMASPARISIVTMGAADVARSGTELRSGYGCCLADPDDHVREGCHNPSFPIGPDGRITID